MTKDVTFRIKLQTDAKGVTSATMSVEELNRVVKTVGDSIKTTTGFWTSFGKAAMSIEATSNLISKVNGQIKELASSYNTFDTAMRSANTMMGLGEDGFAQMRESISDLSKEIPKTRAELADGLYQAISNGVTDPVEALKFLETSARSSVGGIADLGEVVKVSATIWKNYGLDASSAADIQDKIQLTAKNGVTSFEQLAQALPSVTGNAATLGVSIDELLASFSTLTGVSGNTSEVATQLNAVFNAMVKPSSEAAKMAQEMGIRFDAATIQACGGMQSFLQQLDVAVSQYSKTSGVLEQEVYGRLFGSAEALKALIPLQGELSAKYQENVSAMQASAGTMDEAFAQMASTGEAQRITFENCTAIMTEWVSSAASLAAPMFNAAMGVGEFSVTMTGLVDGIRTAIPFIRTNAVLLATTTKNLAVSTVGYIRHTAAVVAQTVASKAVTAATATWTAVQKGLNLILTANPIGLVVAAIGSLVAGVIAAYNNCETFREICDALWAQIKKLAQLVWGHLVEAFNTVTGAIKTAWQWLKEFFGWDDEGPAEEVNKTTGAIEAQTSAIEGNIQAKKKLSGLTLSADGAQGGAPKGSMSALDKEMQDIKARIEVTVDDTQLRLLGEKLAKLEDKKSKLQFIVDTAGEAPTARVRDMLGGVQMPTMKFDTSSLDKGAKIASKRFKEMEKAQGRFNQTQQDSAGLVGSLGQSFGVMGDAIGGAAGAMLQWASQTIAAIAQVLPQILTLITAKQAEGMAGATASGSSLPFPFNIVAIAAGVTAVIAQFARLPKFADGGIAYGPTLGLFGEYAGASHNPEVVAPLDRLRTLIGGTTEGGGKVEFSIKGRRLVGVMERENHSRGRR